ncbi:hypothetical protein WICPIJ_008242 [Wickerhamomyces pijperi]|uniref:Major facilitator superfamily (MFS) profile domain-containing protein n=1 Tax=Wickerhamomyces pijperi TaxID=599730 RepID=A0A9P8TIZ0_WICPI|nr:hypothetical protein WICPIJ_008242 [Wickerhamomyces pijperi]
MSFFKDNKNNEEQIANFVSSNRDSVSDLTSSNTTDFESARSEIIITDSENEQAEQEPKQEQINKTQQPQSQEAALEADQTFNGDDDAQSVHTLKQEHVVAANNEDEAEEEEDASPKDFVPQESQDVEGEEDLALQSVKSHESIFRDDNSVYGAPTQHIQPGQTESEAFQLALTRTLSRRSLLQQQKSHKESLEEQDQSQSSSEDEGVNPATLDWDSPDDPDNPKNWSHLKKWCITMTTAMICLVVTFGSSLYMSGVPDLMVEMKVSQELAVSGLTFYLLGLALGPALAAPISEVAGRRIVYILSLPISMLFTMGIVLSKNIGSILVLRFFAGFFSSPAMAVAGGTIADMWDYEMMGIAMSGFCLSPFMGPVLGPVISTYAAQRKGWKWPMYINLIFAGLILVPVVLCPETYKPILLRKRAIKRGLKLKTDSIPAADKLKFLFSVTLLTPMKLLFVEPIVMVFSIYIAFVFAVLFGFFEAYPIIFRGVYHMSLGNSGFTFLGILVGFILGVLFYVLIDRYRFFPKNADGTRGRRDANGNIIYDAPETRLILMKVGAVALPPALFWLGWSSKENVHWICPVIAGVPFGFGLILIFFTCILYFSMAYPPLSLASALAANNLFRYILASVFPLFTVQMFTNLHIGWASSVFAFIALAMVPVPWIFEKWGPKLRQISTYGYAAMMKKEMEQTKQLEDLNVDV